MTKMPLLDRMRRRRRAIASALLPVLATVWIGSAAACVGMTSAHESGGDAPGVASGDHAALHHDHGAAHGGHHEALERADRHGDHAAGETDGDHRGGHHGAHGDLSASDRSAAPEGDAGQRTLTTRSESGEHPHSDCPFCAGVADSMPATARAEHAACASVDTALASNGSTGEPHWPPIGLGPPTEPMPAAAAAASRYTDRSHTIAASGVALHLRHCVLLL